MITDYQFWQTFSNLAELYSCGWCSKKFDKPWIYKQEDRYVINGEIAFHWQDTHGFDRETFEDMINKKLFEHA